MSVQFTGFVDEAGKTLDEQIAVTKRLGWNAIETRNVEGKNVCDFTDDEFWAAWEKLQANGIGIAGFGSQIANWGRPIDTDFQIDIEELNRNIPRMHKVGAKIIRIMSYPNRKEDPLSEAAWKKEVFRRLKELARIAADGGIILGHENCNGYAGIGPAQSLEMLEAVDNDALKLIFDTGNRHGVESLKDFYEQVKGHVIHVHVKATKPIDGGRACCYPDEDEEGTPQAVFDDLLANGYEGWISIEPHMKAQVHAGQDIDDAEAASNIFVEYGQRVMRMCGSNE
ncbi:MAG: sugar phosphate isomerase/epimerase [Planctomycetota bacterium]|nr:sugar phosphate isomerase/epimerase [Planctomycetota bacterium]